MSFIYESIYLDKPHITKLILTPEIKIGNSTKTLAK
jgi:hypothetical protein